MWGGGAQIHLCPPTFESGGHVPPPLPPFSYALVLSAIRYLCTYTWYWTLPFFPVQNYITMNVHVHDSNIHNSICRCYRAVIIVISVEFLSFWIGSIRTYARGSIQGFPKIVLIGTHKDKLPVSIYFARQKRSTVGSLHHPFLLHSIRRKRKRSDSALRQKTLHPHTNPKSKVTTQQRFKNFDYTTMGIIKHHISILQ